LNKDWNYPNASHSPPRKKRLENTVTRSHWDVKEVPDSNGDTAKVCTGVRHSRQMEEQDFKVLFFERCLGEGKSFMVKCRQKIFGGLRVSLSGKSIACPRPWVLSPEP
jgi:hypothetical protein